MNGFVLNDDLWRVYFVPPSSDVLIDRTGRRTVGTTDPNTRSVYIANNLQKDFFYRVLLHEIGHCAIISFGMIDYIRSIVYPEHWIDAEEFVCNMIADYGALIFATARKVIGNRAISMVPKEIEKYLA